MQCRLPEVAATITAMLPSAHDLPDVTHSSSLLHLYKGILRVMHILLIEDHRTVAENIATFLRMQDYIVTVQHDGESGLEAALTMDVDLVILDVQLPKMDGRTVMTQMREAGKELPVLLLTARAKREDVIEGLNLGADDYLIKPFDLQELLARVRALLRRGSGAHTPFLQAGDVRLDTIRQRAFKGDQEVSLSPREFALLSFLLHHKGSVIDRPTLLDHVWGGGDASLFSNTVDVHVAYLRRKLGKDIIRTVPGRGYAAMDSSESV